MANKDYYYIHNFIGHFQANLDYLVASMVVLLQLFPQLQILNLRLELCSFVPVPADVQYIISTIIRTISRSVLRVL